MEFGFYAVPRNPDDPEVLEKLFRDLEARAAAVFALVEAGVWPLDDDSRETLALFVIVQALRGPDQRQLMKDLQKAITARETAHVAQIGAGAWIEKRLGLRLPPDQAERVWAEVAREKEPYVVIDAEFHFEQVARLAEMALPHVLSRRWTLVRFDGPALFTSDLPVSVDDPDRPNASSGLITARAITYPMSRQSALILEHRMPARSDGGVGDAHADQLDRRVIGGRDEQRYLNDRTSCSAHAELLSHPNDADLIPARFIRARASTKTSTLHTERVDYENDRA